MVSVLAEVSVVLEAEGKESAFKSVNCIALTATRMLFSRIAPDWPVQVQKERKTNTLLHHQHNHQRPMDGGGVDVAGR
jgi:hypothetical protein